MLDYMIEDQIFLKVVATKRVKRFGKKWKLSSWYIGQFSILKMIENVAYNLDHPTSMSKWTMSCMLRSISCIEEWPDLLWRQLVEILQQVIKQFRSNRRSYWERKNEIQVKHPKLFGYANFSNEIFSRDDASHYTFGPCNSCITCYLTLS